GRSAALSCGKQIDFIKRIAEFVLRCEVRTPGREPAVVRHARLADDAINLKLLAERLVLRNTAEIDCAADEFSSQMVGASVKLKRAQFRAKRRLNAELVKHHARLWSR